MTRECILHIGMHKTGTSSIQESLNGNLAGNDWHYANLGRANHSGVLCSALNGKDGRGKTWNQALEVLREALGQNTSAHMILSGEGLCTLTHSRVVMLRDLLHQYVDHVRVVAYVRSPAGFMESAFQQRLKVNAVEIGDFSESYPQYRFRFEKYDTAFGRENVDLWKFDPKTFPSGCVVRDFCMRLGIDFPSSKIVRINESLSRNAVSLLYAYRKFSEHVENSSRLQRAENELVKRLGRLGGKKLTFLPTLVRKVVHENREDLAWMEERLGASLREVDLSAEAAGVAGEQDVLYFEPEALSWLEQQIEDGTWEADVQPTAEFVAGRVRTLVEKLADEDRRRPAVKLHIGQVSKGENEMNLKEIVAKAKEAAPDALGNIQDGKAVALVREVFKQIAQEVQAMEEGVVKVGGLGQFRVMTGEREKEGQKIAVRKVTFRAAAPTESASPGED